MPQWYDDLPIVAEAPPDEESAPLAEVPPVEKSAPSGKGEWFDQLPVIEEPSQQDKFRTAAPAPGTLHGRGGLGGGRGQHLGGVLPSEGGVGVDRVPP